MYLIDYHSHTFRSCDCEASAEEMVKAAAATALDEFCITDHCDLNYLHEQEYIPQLFYEDYLKAKEFAGDKLKVKFGIEIGQQIEYPLISDSMLSFDKYDMVIGSLHCMQYFDDFCFIDFSKYQINMLMEIYFEKLLEYVKADFDILGHITYPLRYARKHGYFIDIDSYMYETELVLKELIKNGKGIEANTSGLRGELKETMPPSFVLKRYKELGGEIITVGSDAHIPEYVGYGCEQTIKKLKEIGFKYLTTFEKRKPIQIIL